MFATNQQYMHLMCTKHGISTPDSFSVNFFKLYFSYIVGSCLNMIQHSPQLKPSASLQCSVAHTNTVLAVIKAALAQW